jgi:hypothetical protein
MSSRGKARSNVRIITARSAHGGEMKMAVNERIIPLHPGVSLGNRPSPWRSATVRDDGVRIRVK